MSKAMRRVATRLAMLAVLPLVLTGCFRVDLAIRVNDDGSGTMTMLVAFDESLLALMQAEDGTDGAGEGEADDPLGSLADIDPSELPPGATVEPYREDEFAGVRITLPFEATDDVAASLEEAFAASGEAGPFGGDSGAPLEDFVLRQEEDGGWRFEASATSPASGEGEEALDSEMTRLLLADASFVMRLQLPGEVVETNADERGADGELIWNIDPAGDDRTLFALAEAGGGTPSALLIGGGAALLTAAVVIGLGYWIRRRASGEAVTSAPNNAAE